jgi:putative ATP-dependent endonuclease of OLD family
MKLTTLRICNFQCFGPTATTIELDDVTYLLGPNGAGKTAALHALARLFAVDPSLRVVRLGDFHVQVSTGITAEPAPEPPLGAAGISGQTPGTGAGGADAQPTVGQSVAATESDSVRTAATPVDEARLWIEAEFALPEVGDEGSEAHPSIPEFLFQMRLEDVAGPMRVRVRLTAVLDEGGDVEERLEFVLARDASGEPTKVQPVASYARRRIQLHYLPARRNPGEQISYAPSSLLGNALRAANWQTENLKIQAWNSEITKALGENQAIAVIGRHLTENWGLLHKGDHYSSPTIGFGQSHLDLLLRQLTVNFAPSPHGPAINFDLLSDGQQSLLYLTTVLTMHQVGRAILTAAPSVFNEEKFRPAVFTMLAFEEPENSLSPFYLGRVLNLLKSSASEADCQAVIATHSPAVVRRVLPEHIRYLRLDELRFTRVRTVELPPDEEEAFKYVQQAVAAYPELYFARLVILGEGASEEVFLPRLFSAAGTDVDEHSVAVVPLGGRHVNHMWRLLNGLGIPHITLLDLDICRFGGGWGRVRTAVKNLQEYSSHSEVQTQLSETKVSELPTWKVRDLASSEVGKGWLRWLEGADVFYSAPLDLDLLLLEHYRDAYPTEQEAPEGDTSDGSADSNSADRSDGAEAAEPSFRQVLGRKGLDPTVSYSRDQLDLFPRYRGLFQLGSKPAAHLVALSQLTDEQLLEDLPPVMQRLVKRASQLLEAHGE